MRRPARFSDGPRFDTLEQAQDYARRLALEAADGRDGATITTCARDDCRTWDMDDEARTAKMSACPDCRRETIGRAGRA